MFDFTGTEALLYKKKYLVLSDLHLGIEKELAKKGINIFPQTKNILNKIKGLKEKYNAKGIILDGDIKHNIPDIPLMEMNEIVEFFNELSLIFNKIYIIKGNHDGDIEKLTPKVNNIKIVKELYDKKSNVDFLHGNKKPKFDADIYVIGHHHFVKTITSSIGESFYEKVFVIAYTKDDKEIIILPSFSDLAGYWESNSFHGPITKNIDHYEIYLLDGTFIEEVNLNG